MHLAYWVDPVWSDPIAYEEYRHTYQHTVSRWMYQWYLVSDDIRLFPSLSTCCRWKFVDCEISSCHVRANNHGNTGTANTLHDERRIKYSMSTAILDNIFSHSMGLIVYQYQVPSSDECVTIPAAATTIALLLVT